VVNQLRSTTIKGKSLQLSGERREGGEKGLGGKNGGGKMGEWANCEKREGGRLNKNFCGVNWGRVHNTAKGNCQDTDVLACLQGVWGSIRRVQNELIGKISLGGKLEKVRPKTEGQRKRGRNGGQGDISGSTPLSGRGQSVSGGTIYFDGQEGNPSPEKRSGETFGVFGVTRETGPHLGGTRGGKKKARSGTFQGT